MRAADEGLQYRYLGQTVQGLDRTGDTVNQLTLFRQWVYSVQLHHPFREVQVRIRPTNPRHISIDDGPEGIPHLRLKAPGLRAIIGNKRSGENSVAAEGILVSPRH